MRFRAFAPLALAGVDALAACGGGGDTSADTTVPADATVVAATSDTGNTADTSVPTGTADTSIPAEVTVATTAAVATAVASAVTVTAIEGIAWDEKDYTATAGDVVITAVNESSLPHNLYIVDPSGARLPDVLDIPSRGDSADETVTLVAGTYTLICTIPGHNNMKSTLTVN